jgi:hypothetical protein
MNCNSKRLGPRSSHLLPERSTGVVCALSLLLACWQEFHNRWLLHREMFWFYVPSKKAMHNLYSSPNTSVITWWTQRTQHNYIKLNRDHFRCVYERTVSPWILKSRLRGCRPHSPSSTYGPLADLWTRTFASHRRWNISDQLSLSMWLIGKVSSPMMSTHALSLQLSRRWEFPGERTILWVCRFNAVKHSRKLLLNAFGSLRNAF